MSAFRDAVESGSADAIAAQLSPDVEFRSPAVFRPYQGSATVGALLTAVLNTFEDFRYVAEYHAAEGTGEVLHFQAHIGDVEFDGIDILQTGDDGLVTSLMVMIRPLKALQTVAATLGAYLEAHAPTA